MIIGAALILMGLWIFAGRTISAGSFVTSVGQFISYGLGITSVLLILTPALVLFKRGVVSRLRGVVPYVPILSAVLLVMAGAYIVFYWWPVLAGDA